MCLGHGIVLLQYLLSCCVIESEMLCNVFVSGVCESEFVARAVAAADVEVME